MGNGDGLNVHLLNSNSKIRVVDQIFCLKNLNLKGQFEKLNAYILFNSENVFLVYFSYRFISCSGGGIFWIRQNDADSQHWLKLMF